jgi:hypothetical protein
LTVILPAKGDNEAGAAMDMIAIRSNYLVFFSKYRMFWPQSISIERNSMVAVLECTARDCAVVCGNLAALLFSACAPDELRQI